MPGNAEIHDHGDCSIPNVPDPALSDDDYFAAVTKGLEDIVGRYRHGRASKVEVQTTIVAYIAVAATGTHKINQAELNPWFEQLNSDARNLERAEKSGKQHRGGEDDDEDEDEDNGVKTIDDDPEDDTDAPKNPKKSKRAREEPNSDGSGTGSVVNLVKKPKRKRTRKHRSSSIQSSSDEEQDDSLFGWGPAARLKEVQLTAAHRKIRAAVENHARDIKRALQNLNRTGAAPNFPQALWKKVLLDEVVDLDEVNAFFFSTKLDLDPVPVSSVESALHKALGRSTEKKTVNSSLVWFRCFDKYSRAVRTVFPYRADELATWRQHIDDLFTAKIESSHHRVITYYDIAARKVFGNNPAILFDQTEAPELIKLRSAFLERDGVCYDSEEEAGPSTKPSQPKPAKKREVCNNWNESKCPRNPCTRRHVCNICGGLHVASMCKSKSK